MYVASLSDNEGIREARVTINGKEVNSFKCGDEVTKAYLLYANTADAIAAIFELVKLANITAESGSKAYVQHLFDTIVQLCDILGIITEKKEELLDDDIEALIEERQAARKAKNFARADEIRDMLADKGIILEDTRAGVKWKRA